LRHNRISILSSQEIAVGDTGNSKIPIERGRLLHEPGGVKSSQIVRAANPRHGTW
jgi:hypothetical protein